MALYWANNVWLDPRQSWNPAWINSQESMLCYVRITVLLQAYYLHLLARNKQHGNFLAWVYICKNSDLSPPFLSFLRPLCPHFSPDFFLLPESFIFKTTGIDCHCFAFLLLSFSAIIFLSSKSHEFCFK